MPEGRDYAYGAGPGGGLGNKIGQIGSPLENPGYELTAGGTQAQLGGEPAGPFGQHMQSESILPIVGRDGMNNSPQEGFANLGGSQARVVTPMETSTAMPGLSGQSGSGTGPQGGGKISSPFSSPWGDSVG